jgi:hypothetical protein
MRMAVQVCNADSRQIGGAAQDSAELLYQPACAGADDGPESGVDHPNPITQVEDASASGRKTPVTVGSTAAFPHPPTPQTSAPSSGCSLSAF